MKLTTFSWRAWASTPACRRADSLCQTAAGSCWCTAGTSHPDPHLLLQALQDSGGQLHGAVVHGLCSGNASAGQCLPTVRPLCISCHALIEPVQLLVPCLRSHPSFMWESLIGPVPCKSLFAGQGFRHWGVDPILADRQVTHRG